MTDSTSEPAESFCGTSSRKLRSSFTVWTGIPAKVVQGRITGAEIVEREFHAERGDGAQRLFDLGIREHRLHELELEARGRDAVLVERGLHHAHEVVVLELLDRHVDREHARRDAGARPLGVLAAGRIEHETADVGDEPGMFGGGNELAR